VQTGRLLSVHDVVVGTIGKLGESYSLSVRLVNVETGEVSKSSRRMQQGAIDAVVSNALPQIAADLLGTEPLPPISEIRMVSTPKPKLDTKPMSEGPWIRRHEGIHPRAELLVGFSSFVEMPLGVRLGGEWDGYGAMVGAGPFLEVISAGKILENQRLSIYVPQLELFYGWRNLQFDLSYCLAEITDISDGSRMVFSSYSADIEIGLGLPWRPDLSGGFGILAGIGYQKDVRRGTGDPTDSWATFVPHFAIVLSSW
jgi:hypothetical protein